MKIVLRLDVTAEVDLERAQEIAHHRIRGGLEQEGLAPNEVAESPVEAAAYLAQEPSAAAAGAIVSAVEVGVSQLFGTKGRVLHTHTAMLPGGDLPPSTGDGPGLSSG